MGDSKVLEMIDSNRKKPWKSMMILDPWTILKFLFRQLTMHDVADLASKVIGCKTGVVEMPFAEACMDVDKQSDLEMAETILKARGAVQEPVVVS